MEIAFGMINGGSWLQSGCFKNRKAKRFSSYSSSKASLTDQYRTLRIQPGASEAEIKKSFRQLALQYHPDVCKGNNCGIQFHRINEAYDVVMSNLKGESNNMDLYESYDRSDEDDADGPMRGMCDPDWELWEEWMGWEGAGIRDYSSHVNPYI